MASELATVLMPKATIHENHHVVFQNKQIGGAGEVSPVQPVAEPRLEQCTPYKKFGASILGMYRLHHLGAVHRGMLFTLISHDGKDRKRNIFQVGIVFFAENRGNMNFLWQARRF